jgi:hypothetical protein
VAPGAEEARERLPVASIMIGEHDATGTSGLRDGF